MGAKRKWDAWKALLVPLSWAYGAVIWVRNTLFDQGVLPSEEFPLPVISLGNITVGGTGKTPHTEYLAELLLAGRHVAILSRGYGRKTRDFRIVAADSPVADVGDEPLQIKRRFPEAVVAVDRKRAHGIRELMKLAPPVEAILLDDAYQHRWLRPGFSILLMDFNRPNDTDRLLPAGRLREPASNRSRANLILVTRSPERMKPIERREFANRLGLSIGQHLYFTSIRYGDLFPVFPSVEPRTKDWFREHVDSILIVTGIASPRAIRSYARSISPRITEIAFPDHHAFRPKDLEQIRQTHESLTGDGQKVLILTTEKDAARFRDLDLDVSLKESLHAVRIHIHFQNNDQSQFDKQILAYVDSNKRSSILHQESNRRKT